MKYWVSVVVLSFMVVAPVAAQESGSARIELNTVIDASPTRVFEVLVGQIGEWWDPSHTHSGESKNLTLEAKPGGCFCEALPGGGVEHMRVIYSAPGVLLRMSGGLGPLQETAVNGTMTISLVRQSEGTTLQLSYALSGFMPGGLTAITPAIESVLAQQLVRLKNFMETGRPNVT